MSVLLAEITTKETATSRTQNAPLREMSRAAVARFNWRRYSREVGLQSLRAEIASLRDYIENAPVIEQAEILSSLIEMAAACDDITNNN